MTKCFVNNSIYSNENIVNENLYSFNESQDLSNILSKKTLREENETKESSLNNSNKKIFAIKKVSDKKKENEIENKMKKYTYRGSKYRGVSKNGKTWQVLIMINRNKNYIGNFKSEDEAAHAYDELAKKYHKDKARLNFSYEGFKKYINEP